MIDFKTTYFCAMLSLYWLSEYADVMYHIKKNKPLGKVNTGWIDNGEWM